MPTFEQLLQGVPTGDALIWASILPFLLGLFLVALALRRTAPGGSTAWGASLALLGAWIAIHIAVWGPPPMPPVMAYDWLIVGVPLAALAALWTAANRDRRKLGLAIQVVAAVTLAGLTLWPRLRVAGWGPWENTWRSAVLGGAILVAWLGALRGAARRPARESLGLQLATASCAAIAVGMSGTQNMAQAAGGVAACLAGALLASMRQADGAGRLALGSAPIAAAAVGGLLLNGHLFAYVELRVFLLCLAPLLLAPAGALLWPNKRGLIADALRVLVLAAPALLGAALAVMTFQAEAATDGSAGYY
ncbi:hypothetical protein [Engelhardtia mirabilis]|uniref:Uncharacterized protein n=1 Tax=Engelhardtia mirabilis TaxID=2528011 RepID=A0A518BP44_9BACT|nr:hypothetical protein Pla133_38060 [Planctomycetes bacterium Pla133]QDV03030.1 hypothetical protein Pla86_38050 [Planctomycetes bacterium Pla86]